MDTKRRDGRSRRTPRSALPERVVRSVLEHAEPRLVIDRDDRIVLVNAAAERRLGEVMSALVGRSVASLPSPGDASPAGSAGRFRIVALP